MSRISVLLKRYRENCDLSQQQVAQVLNIDRSTYTYYETGKTIPSINTIVKISHIFNVPYTVFLDTVDQEIFSEISVSDLDLQARKKEDVTLKTDDIGKIYELKKEEKELLIYYRLLSKDNKEAFMNEIKEAVQNDSETGSEK